MARKHKKNSMMAVDGVGADDGEGAEGGEAVISVDNRCLSCSGQTQHVLSGFKMACLQYAPGPVTFSKKLYKREELLDLRQRLLEQAQDQLYQGPAVALGGADAAGISRIQHELEAATKQIGGQEALERPSSENSDAVALKHRALPPISSVGPQDSSRPMTAR